VERGQARQKNRAGLGHWKVALLFPDFRDSTHDCRTRRKHHHNKVENERGLQQAVTICKSALLVKGAMEKR